MGDISKKVVFLWKICVDQVDISWRRKNMGTSGCLISIGP
jgi:hypothetical protein